MVGNIRILMNLSSSSNKDQANAAATDLLAQWLPEPGVRNVMVAGGNSPKWTSVSCGALCALPLFLAPLVAAAGFDVAKHQDALGSHGGENEVGNWGRAGEWWHYGGTVNGRHAGTLAVAAPKAAAIINAELTSASQADRALAEYRAELQQCRDEHGGSYEVPDVKFFLFGMGARAKLFYRGGALFDARDGRELRRWKVKREVIVPPDYAVHLETEDGKAVVLREDAEAVWLEEGAQRTALANTKSPVKLPDFAGRKFPRVLRVLHQELLVNIMEAGPVPNLFVYAKPWYRDGAMVALALKETGNLDLLKPWILGLREPYDRNNNGETEADNLGQALFLVSLVADTNHPLVAKVLAEVPRFEKQDTAGKFILGRSDFADHPVYQTKWLKFGLRSLGLPDDYIIPKVADSYGALFWMDFRDQHVAGKDSDDRGRVSVSGLGVRPFSRHEEKPAQQPRLPADLGGSTPARRATTA